MPSYTQTGIEIQTLQQAFEQLATDYRVIYGQDINLDPNSPDGNRVGIEAKARVDQQEFTASVAFNFDPDFARGAAQESILKLCGIRPRPATRSTWDLVLTANRALTLNAGYTVEDDLGQQWETLTTNELVAGSNTVSFVADEFGAIEGDPTSEFNQVTVVTGITGISASVDAVVGVDEETEKAVRIRRRLSVEKPSWSQAGKIFGDLGELANVTDLAVYENGGSTANADGVPANSVYVVIEGGDVNDIAETIAKSKTIGANTFGAESATWVEEVTRPNGAPFIINHVMSFDRPAPVNLFIRLTATRRTPDDPIDTQRITDEILTNTFVIGEVAQAGLFYSDAYRAGSNFIITDLEISTDDITYTDGKLNPGIAGKFLLDATRISITEVEA